MTKPKKNRTSLVFFLLVFMGQNFLCAQEERAMTTYNNQISTNLMLPFFESVDLSYERTIANKWAIGLSGAIYGDRIQELSTEGNYDNKYDTNYEVMPFVRVYFQGAQNKSHFLELFGSLSQVTESGRFLRTTNPEGFGVYRRGETTYTAGGLGIGYGYRFFLLDRRMVLEAQFGVRTNFNTSFIVLNGTLVRTGIKIGYRF